MNTDANNSEQKQSTINEDYHFNQLIKKDVTEANNDFETISDINTYIEHLQEINQDFTFTKKNQYKKFVIDLPEQKFFQMVEVFYNDEQGYQVTMLDSKKSNRREGVIDFCEETLFYNVYGKFIKGDRLLMFKK
jgi:hypothetical protein